MVRSSSGFSRQRSNLLWVVTFEDNSQGQVAMVIYEWKDVEYLGKATGPQDDYLPVCLHFILVDHVSYRLSSVCSEDIRLHLKGIE